MALDAKQLASGLLAELCVQRTFGDGRLGAFVEGLPPLEPQTFISALSAKASRPPRVALLGGAPSRSLKAPPGVKLTMDPIEANRWRNDKEARAGTPTVVLVLGPAEKLNSLRSAMVPLGAADLRNAVVERAIGLHTSPERRALWRALSEQTSEIATAALLEFAAFASAARAKSLAVLSELEPKGLHLVGLLPYQALFAAGGLAIVRRALQRDLDLIRRMRDLSAKERAILAAGGEDRDTREREVAGSILRFARTGRFEDLGKLSYEDIDRALRTRPKPDLERDDDDEGTHVPPRRERIDGDELAAKLLLDEDGRGLAVAAKRFRDAVEPGEEGEIEPEEIQVGRHSYLPRPKVGTTQGTALFDKLLTDEVWGGVVVGKGATDFVAATKLVASGDARVDEFRPTASDSVRDLLQRAADRAIAPADALARWDVYAKARAALLPYAAPLIDHPLLALAGDVKLRERAEALLRAYGQALAAVSETAEALRVQSVEASRKLLARAIVLDVVFLVAGDEIAAVAAPTHPFHIYRCALMADLIRDHRDEINAVGGKETIAPLLTDPIACAPHLVLSPFATHAVQRAEAFIAVGAFGALPQFAQMGARRASKFRVRSLARIAERFLRLMPHASFGLRVVLIDPPSVSGAIEDLVEIASAIQDGGSTPLHAVVFRTRAARESTDEEEESVDALARELRDAGGSLTFEPRRASLIEVAQALQANPPHIAVVFDPGDGKRIQLGLTAPPPLSPLSMPRAYHYDQFQDRLDVVVAGDIPLFSAYHDMFCQTLDMPRTDFLGRRSGASESTEVLGRIAEHAIWTVVVDQAVEPTLGLKAARLLDWRTDAGRDVVTFTAHPETVEGLIADAVRAAGLTPDEETVKRTSQQLFGLSGSAVLGLARSKPGASLADVRVAKGVIGVLAAARWYSTQNPDALVISLDDSMSQRWILGAGSDNRRGDLLAIRSASDGIVVEAIEVKAHGDEDAGVKVHGGRVEGRAVTQVDQTLQTLRTILAPGVDSPVVRARRDVLRDQLYRAIASRAYERDQRARLVRLLEELFSKGAARFGGLIFGVTIQAGAASSAPSSATLHRSPAGNDVGIVDVVEGGALGRPRSPVPAKPRSDQRERTSHKTEPTKTQTIHDHVPPQKKGQERAEHASVRAAPVPEDRAARPPSRARLRDVKVLIGTAPSEAEVYWEPHRPDAPLNNFGFHVTGDSGAGKTQILRALISAITALGIPVCVFDNKNDYAALEFSGPAGLRVYDIDEDGLPFNPLSLVGDERGLVQPIKQIHEITGILRRVFKLGGQQEARLKDAMVQAYERRGVHVKVKVALKDTPGAPGFGEVIEILREDPKNDPLLNRLAPLFDLDLFPDADKVTATFEEILNEPIVLDLHRLPNDNIRSVIAEFLIVRIHSHILRGEQPRELRRLLVFDEAWRVQESQRLQELAREGRAFGVGIAVGSQFPGDVHENLAGNLATQLLLQNQDPDHRRVVVRTLLGTTAGPEATKLSKTVGQLQKYEGFFRNQQYAPYTLVRTLPHHARTGVRNEP